MSWLRYTWQKIDYAWQIGYKLGAQGESVGKVWKRLSHEIDSILMVKGLTEVIDLTGTAMTPTLNPKAEKDRDAVDHLLLRRIPLPTTRTCHVGDIVAFHSPYRFGDHQTVLVRRIAAMPGDQMLSDSVSFEPFVIPYGHCWVLADNPKSEPSSVVDSRFFGPLPLDHIRGRVIYNGYDKHDHGIVINSPQATPLDDVLLKYELSLDRLFNRM